MKVINKDNILFKNEFISIVENDIDNKVSEV